MIRVFPERIIARTDVIAAQDFRGSVYIAGQDSCVLGPDVAPDDVRADGNGGDAAAPGGRAAAALRSERGRSWALRLS